MGRQSKLDNGQLHNLKKWIDCFISYLCCFSLESFSSTHPCNMPYYHIHVICLQKTRRSATRKEANATTAHVNEAVLSPILRAWLFNVENQQMAMKDSMNNQ